MADETPQSKARDALFAGIENCAEAAQEADDGDPVERLGKLADAYSKVAYGPQGGDLHETTHEGEERKRPPLGFRTERQ